MADGAAAKAKVMHMEEAFWELPPGHFQAFSKLLVHPTNAATRFFDFWISSYQAHMVVHIPPGVRHGIFNTGLEDLVFLVVASPPADMPAVSQTGGRDVQAP